MKTGKIMTKDDLRSICDASFDKILTEKDNIKGYGIRSTSGTTGHPLVILGKWKYPFLKDRYNSNKPDSSNSVVILFGPISLRLNHVKFFLDAKENNSDSIALALDPTDLNEHTQELLKDIKPDFLYVVNSFLFKMMSYVEDKDLIGGIKRILLSSELLTSVKEKMLKDKFPNTTFTSWYISSETGVLGINKGLHLKQSQYHIHDGVKVEINDSDERGIGSILISREDAPTGRLKQYNIGDIGRLIPGKCSCGEESILEVIGRTGYDYIKVAGTIVRREEVDRVMKELQEYIIDFEMEVREKIVNKEIKGLIRLKILPSKKLLKKENCTEFICKEFSKELFLTAKQTLNDLELQEIFLPTEVEFVENISQKGHKKIPIKFFQDSV